MSHLSEQQLSALLDEALEPSARDEAERHLEGCAACRDRMAELVQQDRVLAESISHDPGAEYFERFADRVEQRLRESAPAKAPAPRAGGPWGWLSPSRLRWVGVAAVLVVGAGVVFMVNRERKTPALERPEIAQRLDQVSGAPEAGQPSATEEGAPAEGAEGRQDRDARAGEDASAAAPPAVPQGAAPSPRNEAEPNAAPGRSREVQRVRGEELPADDETVPTFAAPPPAPTAEGGVIQKPTARPLEQREKAKASNEVAKDQASAEREIAKGVVKLEETLKSAPAPVSSFASPTEKSSPGATFALPVDSLAGVARGQTRGFAPPEAAATREVCGMVKDHAGRPIAGAQVTMVGDGERSIVTEASGRYCLAITAERFTLAVYAVGFKPEHRWISVEADRTSWPIEQDVTMHAISVIDINRAMRGESPTPVDKWPDSARVLARSAQNRSMLAARARSATMYDLAADDWGRVVAVAGDGIAAVQARFALAEARLRAGEITPTETRRAATAAALEAYLSRAPKGTERDIALRWLERVKP